MALKTTEFKVADYMSPRPITASTADILPDAINLMAERDIGNLVIRERHKPIGILTEREILLHLVKHKKFKVFPLTRSNLANLLPSTFKVV